MPGKLKERVIEKKAEGFVRVRAPHLVQKLPPKPVVKPVRGLELVARCIDALSKHKGLAKGATPAVLKRMRLRKFPLPPTLERFLEFDRRVPRRLPRQLAPMAPKGLYFQLPRAGDQMNFVFVGLPNADGEFPVVGLDWEGVLAEDGTLEGEFFVFLKYPSFDLYLADLLEQHGMSDVARLPGFKSEVKEALRLNVGLTI